MDNQVHLRRRIMSERENQPVPEPDWKDRAHAIVRAGLGSVPIVGAAATELCQMVITPSLEKRRVEWMNWVAESLKKLEEKKQLQIEDLASNEAFLDTMLHATQATLRNSQEEKRKALRNAVLNSALPNPPEESRQQMFVEWIDSLSVWHLRIFVLLANPLQWFNDNQKRPPEYFMNSSLSDLLTKAYPELNNQRPLYDQIGKDLFSRGLIGTENFHGTMSASGAFANRATELGREFLKFITAPVHGA
jgi:hypothetical protein